jgi:transcriptional regulator with XRE-family HTH domain
MDTTADSIDCDIGRRVHALRAAAGMTLEALAERSGVSRAMLSRVERGESSPTAQLLNRVAAGLGVTLSALFPSAGAVASPVSRRRAQPEWRDPGSGYLRRIVSPPGAAAEIVEVEFPPGAAVAFESSRLAAVDQQVWVLQGTMEMTVGDEVTRLGKGDCLHMRLDRAIGFRNPSGRVARYVVVLSRNGAAP